MEQKSGGAFQWPSFERALRVDSQGCEECRKCLERFSTNPASSYA